MKDPRFGLYAKKAFIYLLMIFFGLLSLIPVYLVLINVTRTNPEINSGLSFIPSDSFLDNWRALNSKNIKLSHGFMNSLLLAAVTSFCSVYFSAMTAYGLHLYRFAGRRVLWGAILVVMMLPAMLSFIGFYLIVSRLQLLDTYIPLVVPAIASAGVVFFLRQYLSSLPAKELAEVSRIDGAGEFLIFHVIALPLMAPALAAQAFFAFIASWNSFFMPFLIISDPTLYTLPMLLVTLQGRMYDAQYGGIYLGIAISIVPVITVYAFSSRYIISGITMGSLKE